MLDRIAQGKTGEEISKRSKFGWTFGRSRRWLATGALAGAATMMLNLSGASADVIYASNWGSIGSVSKIATGGSPVSLFATNIPFAEGLAFDSSGNLFVGLQQSDQIDKITPSGGITTFASGLSGFVGGLAFDRSGNLYAAIQPGPSSAASGVQEITPAGVVSTFVTGLPGAPAGAQALAFDASGNLFVSDHNANEVIEITPSGSTSIFTSAVTGPEGLAFDKSGNLYVGSTTSNTISEFSPSGTGGLFATVPNGVWGLTFDSSGDLLVGSNSTTVSEVLPNGTVSTYATGLPGAVFYLADPATAAVPEPTGAVLILGAAISLLRRRRTAPREILV